MQSDDHKQAVQTHASAVVAAVMKASGCNDPAQCCFDIIGAAALLAAGHDAAVKSAVASYMVRMAQRLDCDLEATTTLQ